MTEAQDLSSTLCVMVQQQKIFDVARSHSHRGPHQNCKTRAELEFVEVAFVADVTTFAAISDEPERTPFFEEF